jgi:hypothetical protein
MVLVTSLVLLLGMVAVIFFLPDSVNLSALLSTPEAVSELPTVGAVAVVPTLTDTPEQSLAPTYTPRAVDTPDVEPTNTRRPTAAPSATLTLPPSTPTRTPTSTPTDTPTPTHTPTETPIGPPPTATNTRSPFPFTKTNDSPLYLRNFANTAGCNWMGVAGEVLDVTGNPVGLTQYVVHVWDSGLDARVPVGGAPAYGPSGWEQFLFDSPVVRNYNIQLETSSGTPVSQVYQVTSLASCNQNLVYMIFLQNH